MIVSARGLSGGAIGCLDLDLGRALERQRASDLNLHPDLTCLILSDFDD
jgi:hypothetical protein